LTWLARCYYPFMYAPEILPVSRVQAEIYWSLFVNQLAYTQQTDFRDDRASTNRYYRPVLSGRGTPQVVYRSLNLNTVSRHVGGHITAMFYSTNPSDSTCRWVCIDADYENGMADLEHLKEEFEKDAVTSLIEESRRGGHLWILNAAPLPAALCRRYVLDTALAAGLPIKDSPLDTPYTERVASEGAGERERKVTKVAEGLEVFPKQDFLEEGAYGNGVRGPLCVHRKNYQRYWFADAPPNLAAQFELLLGTGRLDLRRLQLLLEHYPEPDRPTAAPDTYKPHPRRQHFNIFSYFPPPPGKAYYHVVCPACQTKHLKITATGSKSGYYNCLQSGCSSNEIRAALGAPIYDRKGTPRWR